MPFSLQTKIENIGRISPPYKKKLARLGINTLRDLFYHFPRRYEDFSNVKKIADLKVNETATIQAKIAQIKTIRTWKKRMVITEAFLQDETGIIRAVWFNQPHLADTLKEETRLSLSGKVNLNKDLYFSNPSYEKIDNFFSSKTQNLRHTGRLVPIYPETAGLSSRYLRYIIQLLLPFVSEAKDWLPEKVKQGQKLIDLKEALRQVHFPLSTALLQKAKNRLAFDEIFLIQIFSLSQKLKWNKQRSEQIKFNERIISDFVKSLPFKLTNAQRAAAWEIMKDLEQTHPMNRLLQGDVGSGKTIVAAMAALDCAASGSQVALMAPTEILAQQHFANFVKLFSPFDLRVGLLTSRTYKTDSETEIKKTDLLKKIKLGQINIVIGTHSLIQKEVGFKNLVLAIVDEQHRFGVNQRAALQKEISKLNDGLPKKIPHLLSMTATPIPRTLALALYGDLEISVLNEMPKNRQKIITEIISPSLRAKAYEFLRREINSGRQAFIICPRIELPEEKKDDLKNWQRLNSQAEIKAVKKEFEKLSKNIFPEFKTAMLHGKLKAEEKEKIMSDFSNGKIDILVSTSVIEVGIDIPNATVMAVEGAENFGLAQLHQFRGRVGRGSFQSYCLLFTETSENGRLKAMLQSNNGFDLAEKDLSLRGPGDFLGTRQSGFPDLAMASLTDLPLIRLCRQEAADMLKEDPLLKKYPLIQNELKKFKSQAHFE